MKFYLNTDNRDIEAKAVGIFCPELPHRIQVHHDGTKPSIKEATEIATLLKAAPELLYGCKRAIGDIEHLMRVTEKAHTPLIKQTHAILLDALARAEGRIV